MNKVAIVTGGATGIGLEIIKGLTNVGMKVAFCDKNSIEGKRVIKDFHNKDIRFTKVDVNDLDELKSFFNKTINEFGTIDIVINNAGILDEPSTIKDLNKNRMIEINLKAVIGGTLLGIEKMKLGGCIINISSTAAFIPFISPVYCATKAGVAHFTRSLIDVIPENIRVNAILPSFIRTKMTEPFEKAEGAQGEIYKKWILDVGGFVDISKVVDAVFIVLNNGNLKSRTLKVDNDGIQDIEYIHVFSKL